MQPSPAGSITCDHLIEFEEDAAAFAQGKAEFIQRTGPVGPAELPRTPTDPSSPSPPSDPGK